MKPNALVLFRYASKEASTLQMDDPDSSGWGTGYDDLVCFCRDYGISPDTVSPNWKRVKSDAAPISSEAFLLYSEFLEFVQIGAKRCVDECSERMHPISPRLRELMEILRGVDTESSVIVMDHSPHFWSRAESGRGNLRCKEPVTAVMPSEEQRARKLFYALDTDGSGVMHKREAVAAHGTGQDTFAGLNEDSDGKVTQVEWMGFLEALEAKEGRTAVSLLMSQLEAHVEGEAHEAANDTLLQQVQDLETVVTSHKDASELLKRKVADLEHQLDDANRFLSVRSAGGDKQSLSLQQEVADLQADLKSKTFASEVMQVRVAALEAELEESKSSPSQSNTKAPSVDLSASSSLAQLEKQLIAKDNVLKVTQNELADVEAKMCSKVEAFEVQMQYTTDLEAQLQAQDAALGTQRQKVRDLEACLQVAVKAVTKEPTSGEHVEAVRCEVADLRTKLSRVGSVSAQQVSELEAELRARDDECKGLQRKVADLEEQLDAAARRMACLQVTAKAGTKEPGSGEYAGAAVDRTQNGHMEGHGGRADGAQVHSKAHSGPLQGSQGERERARLPAEDAQSRSKSRFPRAGSPNDHYDTKRGLLPKYQSKRVMGGATDPQNSR